MRTILILYDKDSTEVAGSARDRYEDLYGYALEKGVCFCRAPIASYDGQSGAFKDAQFFDGEKWYVENDVKPDAVLDKSPFFVGEELAGVREAIAGKFPFANNLEMSRILSDKWETYSNFKEFSPKTVLIKTERDFQQINMLGTDKIILKPLGLSGGRGIKIVGKEDLSPMDMPFIAQEVISAERGIKGLVEGPHDLRVILVNGKPFYAFLRTPPKGELIANISRGGGIEVVPLDKVPENVMEMVHAVAEKLTKYGNSLYSVDFIVDEGGEPWVLEMNSRPGLVLEENELGWREHFYDNIIKFALSLK